MTIARARPEDLAEIFKLDRNTAEVPHWTMAEYALRVSGEHDGHVRRCLLIAWVDEQVAGYAAGRIVLDEAELESVAVRFDQRRKGIGRLLCTAVLAWSWDEGGVSINLEVRCSSVGAIGLYEGLGFSMVGRRSRYYEEPKEDAVLMRRARL